MRRSDALFLSTCLSACSTPGLVPAPPPAVAPAAPDPWNDGRAEVAVYDLTPSEAPSPPRAQTVAVFVTEPFSSARHVKAEGEDALQVMKLNWIDQEAVDGFRTMTSTFVTREAAGGFDRGDAVKVSFTSQDWCGHVYAQALCDPGRVRFCGHGYWEDRADQARTLTMPRGTLAEDALLLWARGMAGPEVGPGESAKAPVLTSLRRVALDHQALRCEPAILACEADPESWEGPTGPVPVRRLRASVGTEPARAWSFLVEAAPPRRLVEIGFPDGTIARLRGVERTVYWSLSEAARERLLLGLGLRSRP